MVVLSHVGQYGFLLSLDSVKPDLKKINPVEGAKKIFSIRSLVEFLKSTLKVALLSLLVWLTLQGNLASLLRIPACGLDCVAPVSGLMLRQLMLVCAVGFLAIAVADYAFERHQHYKQLRMSKDEVKREYKEMEGSPEIKSKRRQFHQELQSSNLRADVRRSSVIVANPTHVAIGIRYRRGETPLPLVTLKHTDALALRVRRIAEEEGIPVLQRVPLARALLRDGNVDQYIPADLIQATAEVLRWLESQQTDPERYRAGWPPRHRQRKTLRPGAEKGARRPFSCCYGSVLVRYPVYHARGILQQALGRGLDERLQLLL